MSDTLHTLRGAIEFLMERRLALTVALAETEAALAALNRIGSEKHPVRSAFWGEATPEAIAHRGGERQ